MKPVIYGTLAYLFKTTKGEDVLGSFGGDGCGGFGEIRILGSSNQLLTKTGGGCVEDPTYHGEIPAENKIILLSSIKDSWNEIGGGKLDKLYSLDVYTKEQKTILDFKSNPQGVKRFFPNPDKNKLTLGYQNEIQEVNLLNGNITKTPINSSIDLENNYYSYFYKDNLYYLRLESVTNNFNMALEITDIKTGNVKKYDWDKKYPVSADAYIIGFWQDKPLIVFHTYPAN